MYIEKSVRFWKFSAYGLTFGCTAWADAGAIAKIANQWSPQKRDETVNNASPPKWQDAMNYFMGSDSLNDDVKNNIGSKSSP